METTLPHLLYSALWGGLLAFERRAFLQALLSEPLVAACGLAFLLGDFTSGLYIGVVFELFFLGNVSLGGRLPDHETAPVLFAVGLSATTAELAHVPSTPALWGACLCLSMPLGRLMKWIEHRIDVRASRYFERAVVFVQGADVRAAVRQNLRAIWPHIVALAVLCAIAVALAHPFRIVFESLSARILRAFAWTYMGAASVAAFSAVSAMKNHEASKWALSAAVVVTGIALIYVTTTGHGF